MIKDVRIELSEATGRWRIYFFLVFDFEVDKAEKIGNRFPENKTISIVNPPPQMRIKISTLPERLADILEEDKKAVALKNG